MCLLFVVRLRFKESAVQTDGRQPAQRQVETRTTAARVVRHLAVRTDVAELRRVQTPDVSDSTVPSKLKINVTRRSCDLRRELLSMTLDAQVTASIFTEKL
ncbi:hypothetical protein F2P81_022744 [Scophthalmus maximus]|uniref:Uncharacterized protein n=1 Tax=Scophthalmus maximus TaxID=52904 RepID=A0A6A4RV14_SCOMX|nr:hypothetical protein F2P81_022744 [Scophthalmus maximus]